MLKTYLHLLLRNHILRMCLNQYPYRTGDGNTEILCDFSSSSFINDKNIRLQLIS